MGLIPARAGNTLTTSLFNRLNGAHPRSRGEHTDLLNGGLSDEGSSPLARGTHRAVRGHHRPTGLIPARAGNTRSAMPRRRPCRAHPRSRGEHAALAGLMALAAGSSPLARGTTLTGARLTDKCRAHPRSRGEHDGVEYEVELVGGSSPLARGTPRHLHRDCRSNGLIPARAGNTKTRPETKYTMRAHPRSRGEHWISASSSSVSSGSSPLARGTRCAITEI